MTLSKLGLRPGIVKDNTVTESEGTWVDGDKVRFRLGGLENIGGWENAAPGSTVQGIARGLHGWADLAGNANLAIGTHLKAYVYAGGALFDVTPIRQTSSIINGFSTASGSPTITVNDTGTVSRTAAVTSAFSTTNGQTTVTVADAGFTGQVADLVNVASVTVGGITLSGLYPVVTVGSGTYTITAGSAATSTVSNTGSSTLTYYAPHGAAVNDVARYQGSASVGGLTISGEYTIASVPGRNSYTIKAGSNASSTVSNAGGTVVVQYLISPGNRDGVGALGYGTGAYGSGAYGAPQTNLVTYPRTWAIDNWGQNALMNPRGGSLYEWVPNVSTTQLVQNSTFASATGWSTGAGWSIAGGAATKTAGSASSLSQVVSGLSVGATPAQSGYYTLQISLTVTAGTLQLQDGSANLGAAITSSGTYTVNFTAGSTTINLAADASFAGTVSLVSIVPAQGMRQVANAPSQITSCYVLPDLQMVVALGANDQVTGVFDPMLVRWTGQADNTQWTAAITNLAGQYRLSEGSRIVGGKPYSGVCLIWTDTSLYVQTFLPGDQNVFSHKLRGEECGLLGPNAAAVVDAGAYWWSSNGGFYVYRGGVPEPLVCPLRTYAWSNLAAAQQDKVYAFSNAQFNEIWWLYPDARDGIECSRYLIFNYVENWWAIGTFDRTAWEDQGVFPAPIAISSGGMIYFQERTGYTADGGAYVSYAVSGYLDIDDGNELMMIDRIIPDFQLTGALQITLTALREPNGPVSTKGPFTIKPATKYITPRIRGRQIAFNIQSVQAGARFRLGAVRVNRKADGKN